MNTNKPILTLQNISVRLYNKTVFNNTSWSINHGECWAVIGNTGSGKSVLIKAICGELPVIAGEILYNFTPGTLLPNNNDPEKRICCVSFDMNREMKSDDNLFIQSRYWSNDNSLTVKQYLSKENVYEINPFQIDSDNIDSAKYLQIQKNIQKLLQIEHLAAREVNMLSNGESRRVVMARALLKEPALLILDNPFQGLDTQYTEYFCSTIIPSLQRAGVSIILVSNETDRIPDVVSHILYVDSFKAAASGLVSKVKQYLQKSTSVISGSQLTKSLKKIADSQKNKKAPKTDTCIKMTNVTVSYGTKKILQNFSWTVKYGENWAILGPNGSGKTTLLSLVLGDHPQAYANSIEVLGKRLGKGANLWDIKKEIGWVSPELQTCYPLNTTCLNVVLSGYYDSIGLFQNCSSQKRKFAKELFSIFNLSHIQDQPLGSASEGIQRIVLLMRAIVKMPDLLVLDEPCQGIPPNYRKIIFSVIETLAQNGNCTVIFVTHQLNELPSCITNTLNLKQCQ